MFCASDRGYYLPIVQCPKCGAQQSAGGAECVSCGVVFARFRESQERAALARKSVSQPMPVADETTTSVPRPFVIVALVIFVAFGVVWTAKRRQARAKYDAASAGAAMLDEINNKGLKERQRLENEAQRARELRNSGGFPATSPAPPKRPAGFGEYEAKRALEKCAAFTEPQTVRIPKSYPQYSRDYYVAEYPVLAAAEKDKVVQVEAVDGVHRLSLGSYSRMNFTETADHYVFNLGRRRITNVRELTGSADEAEVRFDFVYTSSVTAETLLAPTEHFYGFAYFVRQGGEWRVTRAHSLKKDGTSISLCR